MEARKAGWLILTTDAPDEEASGREEKNSEDEEEENSNEKVKERPVPTVKLSEIFVEKKVRGT